MFQLGGLVGALLSLTNNFGENVLSVPGISLDSYQYCEIKIRIYHSCDATRFLEFCAEDGARLFRSSLYDPRLCRTAVVALPFVNGPGHQNVRLILDALASQCRYNIILLENSATTLAGSVMDYPSTLLRTYRDSQIYAEALNGAMRQGLLSEKCIMGIGFSLGAQTIGHVCRQLDRKCCQIYAVDAAGPLNVPGSVTLPHLRIVSRTDACHVVSLQCNRWMLGTPWRGAHVNLKVNGGIQQPGCNGDPLCSHVFCNRLLADAIRRPGACQARSKCDFGRHCTHAIYRLDLGDAHSCDSCSSDQSADFYYKSSVPQCSWE